MAKAKRPPELLTLGWQVIEWAEEFLCHGPGDVQGEPLELSVEACAYIVRAYQLDENGRRIVRRAGLYRPKGWAKTELFGVIAAAELCGPVRFDGFNAKGEPVGRPVTAPRCYVYATEEGQAGEGYAAAAYMLENGRAFDEYRLDVGLTRTFVAGGGELVAKTSAPTSAEGGKTTFAGFDESSYWNTPRLRDLHRTVLRNLGKRGAIAEPWSMETSNMYVPGEESVAEGTLRYWAQLLESHDGDVDAAIRASGVFVDTVAPRKRIEGKLADASDRVLEAALREVYGDAAAFQDFARLIGEIRDPEADDADSRRFWLNEAVRGDDAWLDEGELEQLDGLADDEREVPEGSLVCLGFDGSLSDDSTVLKGCTIGRDALPFLFTLGIWEVPPDATPRERAEWVVDREDVLDAVDEAFELYDVVLMYADPAYWTPEVAMWASKFGDDVVREFPTHRDYRMAPAVEALRTAVVTAGIEWDADARVRRHYTNAKRRRTRHGVTVRKDPRAPADKIDAVIGDALALEARNDALAANMDELRRRHRRRRRRGGRPLHAF